MRAFYLRLLGLIAALGLLSGCTEVDSTVKDRFPTVYSMPIVHSDVDELLEFGHNFANMNASSRTETCRSLLKRQKEEPEVGVLLHVMIGRLLSDSCGDIPKILDEIANIPPTGLADERMRHLVAIHHEALKRMNSSSKKINSLERKHKAAQQQPVTEPKDTDGAKNEESKLLREKLEAIRSMEKQLDETSEGK